MIGLQAPPPHHGARGLPQSSQRYFRGCSAGRARELGAEEVYDGKSADVIDALRAAHPDGVDAVLDLFNGPDAIKRDAEVIRPGRRLVSTIFAADEGWFAQRQITAHNHSSRANPLISPQGLTTVGQMLADGTITARIGSTVDLDGAGRVLEDLRHGGLHGKAIIRLLASARAAAITRLPGRRSGSLPGRHTGSWPAPG